jgi:hypothetical protein
MKKQRTSKLLILLKIAYNDARAARVSGIMSLVEGVVLVGERGVWNRNSLDMTYARMSNPTMLCNQESVDGAAEQTNHLTNCSDEKTARKTAVVPVREFMIFPPLRACGSTGP